MRTAKADRAIEVSLRVAPVYNVGGELIASSTICHDITRQKLLEAQLRRSSRYFDLSRDLTALAGFDGYFKSVNPALERILGRVRCAACALRPDLSRDRGREAAVDAAAQRCDRPR